MDVCYFDYAKILKICINFFSNFIDFYTRICGSKGPLVKDIFNIYRENRGKAGRLENVFSERSLLKDKAQMDGSGSYLHNTKQGTLNSPWDAQKFKFETSME